MGPGVATYFDLMKVMGFATLFVACTCVPRVGLCAPPPLPQPHPSTARTCSTYAINIIFTLTASKDVREEALNGVEQLARLSLAPLRVVYNPLTGANDWTYGVGTRVQGLDKRKALLVMSCLDCGAMVVLLFVLDWFKRLMRRDVLQADLDSITLSDYSVQVLGLPAEPLSAEEVAAHLEAGVPEVKGLIATTYVAKAYGVLLERLEAKGLLEQQLESLDAQAAATKKDLSKKREALVKQIAAQKLLPEELDSSKLPACVAFVTFDTVAARDAVLKAYGPTPLHRLFPQLLQHPSLQFRGTRALRVAEAGEPTDIMYENLHYSGLSRQLRQSMIGFFVFALLLGTVGITIVAKDYQNSQPPPVSCTSINAGTTLACNRIWNLTNTSANSQPARVVTGSLSSGIKSDSCVSYISTSGTWLVGNPSFANSSRAPQDATNWVSPILANASGSQLVACAASVCQSCYCQAQGLPAWQGNTNGLGPYCALFWKSYIASWALKGMSILFIILSNMAFTKSIPLLTRLEKLPTRGAEQASVAIKIFLSMFFNAYVVTLLVYAGITRLETFPLIFKGKYLDYDYSWLNSIGSSLFITTFTQCVQPPVVAAVMGRVQMLLQRFQVKSQYTQRDLNALFAGPEWNLPVRAAQVLNAAWLALIMCGMFPGIAFVFTFLFWLTYWADKYQLCRVCRLPPRYDARMTLALHNLLVWGVWIHFGVTAWAFGSSQLPAFHLHLSGAEGNAFSAATTTPDGSNGQFNVGARLEKWQCLVQGIPFLLMSLWLFVLQPYGGPALNLVRTFLPVGFLPAEEPDAAERMTFRQAVATSQLKGISSYDIAAIKSYEPAMRALQVMGLGQQVEDKAQAPAEEAASAT
jgi:hypothetical protein